MFWTVLLTVLVAWLAWLVVRDYGHPLDHIQGPRRFIVIGSMLAFWKMNSRTLFILSEEFFKKYKDRYLIKVGRRRILHIYNPTDVEAILSHTKNITKSMPYTFLQPWLGTGLLLSTGSKWHKRRKILTPTFHFNILKNFTTVLEEKSKNLTAELRKKGGVELDLYPLISDVTLYAICETAMGIQLDHDKSASTMEYKQSIQQIGRLLLDRLLRVWLHSDFIFKRHPLGKHLINTLLPKVHTFADDVIRERKRQRQTDRRGDVSEDKDEVGSKKRMAMLDLLLEAESKGEIDLEGIREEVNTFMFEGHDTTATALTFALMLLADHAEVQDRIYEEIQQVLGDREPTMADFAELKYLEAVIKESLRLYPSVTFIARKIEEDFMMGDLFVSKKNTEIAIRIYELHRRADLYPEPEAFWPDRFYNNEPRHPYAYLPFSAGPRNCIGQRFAMLEMKSIVAEVVRRFVLAPRQPGWRPQLAADLVLRPAEPVPVRFLPRA